MSDFKVNKLSPMVPSSNISETRDFMVKCLDFQIFMDTENYCTAHRDSYAVHIMPADGELKDMSFYLEVDNVDKVWQHFSNKNELNIKVKEPFDREYGMREFHLILPSTETLVFVGQYI